MPSAAVRARFSAIVAGLSIAAACASPSSPLASHGGDTGGASAGGGAGGHGAGSSGGLSGVGGHAASGGLALEGGLDVGADGMGTPDGPAPDVAPDVFVDPDGPPELRFLHGLADASPVRACLVPWKAGAAVPTPEAHPSADVAYGGVVPLAPPTGADVGGAFRVVVLGGDLSQLGGASCQSLLASAPAGVHVAALDVVPPATLTEPRSLLMVATGCLGGVALADPQSVCGALGVPPKVDAGADAAAPTDLTTVGLVLAEVSRVPPPSDRIGIQVMHASATLGPLSVRLVPEGGLQPISLAMGLGLGTIAPHPPLALSLDVAFGVIAQQAQVGVADGNGDVLVAGVADGFASSGIPIAELAPGKGFMLVVIGPHPSPSDASTGGNPARVVWMRQPVLGG